MTEPDDITEQAAMTLRDQGLKLPQAEITIHEEDPNSIVAAITGANDNLKSFRRKRQSSQMT